MINQQILEGRWNEIQGRLREHWGELTENELSEFDGNVQQLIGLIQRKTGEGRAKIEKYLDDVTQTASSSIGGAAESLRGAAHQVADSVSEHAAEVPSSLQAGARTAADTARAGYVQTERLVRHHPVESLAVCFGVGLITGVVVGLSLRGR
ncbi:MAG: CsbD family protein [Pirellulales bacterium]